MMVGPPLHADTIGDITELRGYGQILRDEPFPAVLDFDINSYDDVRTRAGRIAITFLDESIVRLTEHSKLVIDEYIYDPNPSKSKMALKFVSGTIRFASGNINKLDKKNISLKTPTADIAVRGTDFTCTVDELGRSLIILLPDQFGDASGEIIVSTAAGQVVLDKPYQATTTDVYESSPTKPVTLDITLDFIDNMLIVSPPKERLIEEEQQQTQTTDYLDLLNVNFLEDLLDVLEVLDEEQEEDQLVDRVSGVQIVGTNIGQDTDTQITTIVQGSEIKLIRNVNQNAQLVLDGENSYTVIFIQDGVSKTIKINGASSSSITIIQNSG